MACVHRGAMCRPRSRCNSEWRVGDRAAMEQDLASWAWVDGGPVVRWETDADRAKTTVTEALDEALFRSYPEVLCLFLSCS